MNFLYYFVKTPFLFILVVTAFHSFLVLTFEKLKVPNLDAKHISVFFMDGGFLLFWLNPNPKFLESFSSKAFIVCLWHLDL